MKEEQRRRIVARHRDSLQRYGHDPRALYWSSKEIQQIRFQKLLEIGIIDGDSVLDVGCGFADFLDYAAGLQIGLRYQGIDLSPDLLEFARERHPGVPFYCGDLLAFHEQDQALFDWVVLSGSLNEQLDDDGGYARLVINLMWRHCRKGVAFNLLDARHGPTRSSWDLQTHYPEEVLAFACDMTTECRLVDGYLPNDFTLHMLRTGN